MVWRKSPPGLINLFDLVIPADPAIERRKMFGYPAAFVCGNLFAGLHQENFVLRLSDDDRARAAKKLKASPFEPMPGRVMREYVSLPGPVLADAGTLRAWIARSLAYATSLPTKSMDSAARKKKKRARPAMARQRG